jgi:AraC-like DNA-binding protein
MFLLTLYTSNYISAVALVLSLTVRIHAGIVHGKPWARFWYLCRAIDLSGTGIVEFDVDDVCHLIKISRSTLYQWLREGKAAGAFRCYRRRKNLLRIYLGGLHKYCLSLGVTRWGATADVPLTDILDAMALKSHATALQTQSQQVKSRIAAIRSLTAKERKFTKVPEIDAILEQGGQSSQKPAKGQVPFLLWVGEKRAFVSKGFIPIGSSQESIAAELGISDRTVRRHLSHLGVKRRQLVQAKAAYKTITGGLDWWAEEVHAEPDRIWYKEAQDGSIWFYDSNGVSSSRKPAQKITRDRFFSYRGKTWIYRCNLYDLNYSTSSMRAARQLYARLIAQKLGATAGLYISFINESASELNLSVRQKSSSQPGEVGQKS